MRIVIEYLAVSVLVALFLGQNYRKDHPEAHSVGVAFAALFVGLLWPVLTVCGIWKALTD